MILWLFSPKKCGVRLSQDEKWACFFVLNIRVIWACFWESLLWLEADVGYNNSDNL
jgi:hypothetical protein